MKLLMDVNRYRDLTDGDEAVVQTLGSAEQIFMPFVTLAELAAGFDGGTRTEHNRRVLAAFLRKPGVGILWPDERTIECYATVFNTLRKRGTPIPTNDIWIAAMSIQHQLTLYTRDRHFDHLPQLKRI